MKKPRPIVDTDVSTPNRFREQDVSADLFAALSLGVRDYLTNCNFKSAVLGLSGGIDSAVVTLPLPFDALGVDNVLGV